MPVAEDPLFPHLVHIDMSLPAPAATRSLPPTTAILTATTPTLVPTPVTQVQSKAIHSAPVVQVVTPQPVSINAELEKKRVAQFAELEAKLTDQIERWKVKALVSGYPLHLKIATY